MKLIYLILTLIIYLCIAPGKARADEECEICISTLEKFESGLPEDILHDYEEIAKRFYEFCISSENQERELCDLFDGMEELSSKAITWVGKPFHMQITAEEICTQVGEAHKEVCQIKTEKDIEFVNELMNKSFSELKKTLYDMNLSCEGCVKKIEFAEMIRIHSKNVLAQSHEEL
ncbi:mesencephalic astrocyte-derived neurotrophic factor like protein [Nephila pilipes]|uniref:Mesencephalic astrocyte-derived neurotrophic factor like protein n=1 Tax=Nephila pilipes TaxID=299642 RepID=A0A8X6TI82_NEPPI|nr:mesencephalic astrocyte-derived neurotrophic factor like protein [Nephila pilipes]